jgi:polyhydroxybutyrate depolymerase
MKNFFFLLFSISVLGLRSQTIVTDSFAYGGVMRNYDVYVPAVYNASTAVPLILNLHGYGSDSFEQELYTDFMPIADTANFIMVFPNGVEDGGGQQYWNAFSYPSPSPNDLGFLSALIDTIEAGYNIDLNRVYSTGMSNGGFMSYDLACGLSNKIAAIASVTGSMIPYHMNTCLPSHPVPVMQIHGTADATVPYNGSSSFVPIDSLVKHWVTFNNCSPTPITTAVPNTVASDGCTATHYVYTGGNAGTTVEFFKVQGGGHSWPGATVNINVTCMDFNASAEIWRFFSQYRLNNLTGVKETKTSLKQIQVYPNPSSERFVLAFPDAGKKTVRLTNAMGQVVQEFETLALQAELKVAEKGIYVLNVRSAAGTYSQKIIKE